MQDTSHRGQTLKKLENAYLKGHLADAELGNTMFNKIAGLTSLPRKTPKQMRPAGAIRLLRLACQNRYITRGGKIGEGYMGSKSAQRFR